MSDLLNQIRCAQVSAAENIVVANLRRMGLADECQTRAERDAPAALTASLASQASVKELNELRTERDALLAQVAALPSLDQVHAIVASHLTSVYLCTRVWSAWSVGTMSEDDFIAATETEFADDLAAAIFAAFGTTPTVPAIPAEAAAVGAVLDPESLEQGDCHG